MKPGMFSSMVHTGDRVEVQVRRGADLVKTVDVAGLTMEQANAVMSLANWYATGAIGDLAVAPDPVVEANRQLLLDRSRVGLAKYGVTLDAAPLSHRALLQHALEEALDFANYMQTVIRRLDADAAPAKDGIAGTHGGTLVNCVENGAHTVAVRVEKDGKPIAQVQALGLSPDQARAVHQLAFLYAASQGDPDRLDDSVRECLNMYAGGDA